jgi:hypothetical protein
MMVYTPKDLLDAVDKNNYKGVQDFLMKSKKDVRMTSNSAFYDDVMNFYDNTLIRSIRTVFNASLHEFNPGIIELLFKYGAKCVDAYRKNTLNKGIIHANLYIRSFKSDEKRLIAEKNALNVLEILVKNGAIPCNSDEDGNTLSVIMGTQNLKILRFMTDTNLCLEPHNGRDQKKNTLECAFNASQKTGHCDFIKAALDHGAEPYLFSSILVPDRIMDCVVFGGNRFIRYLHEKIMNIMTQLCETMTMNHGQIRELLETIVCASGSITMSENYFSRMYNSWIMARFSLNSLKRKTLLLCEIFNDYHALWSGTYDEQCDRIIEKRRRLTAKAVIIMGQRNCRKTEMEIVISGLPICCIDIIHGYDDTNPKLDLIDWSKH